MVAPPGAKAETRNDVESNAATKMEPAEKSKHEASIRTAMIAGWFGIAGTILTCLVTWGLNQLEKKTAAPPPAASVNAPAPQSSESPGAVTHQPTTEPKNPALANIAAVSTIVEAQRAEAARRTKVDALLKQSPISFADWQAAVRDLRISVEQRRELFGSEVGKRVTWQGVYDQYNLITYGPVTRDNSYILVMYETEAARNATPLRPAPALCHFPALAKRQLSELRPGQRIVISGTLANPNLAGQLLGTELQGCELVGVLDDGN